MCKEQAGYRLEWKRARCPTEGPLHQGKNRSRNAVQKRIRWCAAKAVRLRIQRRERIFAEQSSRRFKTPGRGKARCSKLFINNELVQDR